MNLTQIQQELNQGNTIEETLKKHNTNFKEVWNEINKTQKIKTKIRKKQWKKRPQTYRELKPEEITETTYINQRETGIYTVCKSIKGCPVIFGSYTTLKDAQTIRDELIHNGWKKTSVNLLCNIHHIKRCKRRTEKKGLYG